jgi:hypothetical protein
LERVGCCWSQEEGCFLALQYQLYHAHSALSAVCSWLVDLKLGWFFLWVVWSHCDSGFVEITAPSSMCELHMGRILGRGTRWRNKQLWWCKGRRKLSRPAVFLAAGWEWDSINFLWFSCASFRSFRPVYLSFFIDIYLLIKFCVSFFHLVIRTIVFFLYTRKWCWQPFLAFQKYSTFLICLLS